MKEYNEILFCITASCVIFHLIITQAQDNAKQNIEKL